MEINTKPQSLMERLTLRIIAALWKAIVHCSDDKEEAALWQTYFYCWERLRHFQGE